MALKETLILRRPRGGRLEGRTTSIQRSYRGAVASRFAGQLWPAICRAAPRVLWTVASIGLFAGIWEGCWALGWADPKLLPPPHIFLGDIAEQAKFFNTGRAGPSARQ